MGLSAAEYLSQLQALLPAGAAWSREPDAVLTQVLAALAEELARVDARADDLLDEADPRTTYELLGDWEGVAGLPDICTGIQTTLAARRAALVGKVTFTGGASRQFFIDIAEGLGYTVTITEPALHTWQVNGELNTITTFKVNSGVNEALRSWGNALLECELAKRKPAHTVLQFAYT